MSTGGHYFGQVDTGCGRVQWTPPRVHPWTLLFTDQFEAKKKIRILVTLQSTKGFHMKKQNWILLSLLIVIGLCFVFLPESAIAQDIARNINIDGSINSLTSQVRTIGLSLLGASLCCGAVMMGFGNQLGTKIVTSAILGAIILIAATSIIELIKSSVR